jgi:PIN domain nuclease of toxin-antitoxin system
MKLLLDTHALLWSLCEPHKLTPKTQNAIADKNNLIFVSIASLWELQIKQSIGKIILPDNFIQLISRTQCEILPVTVKHIEQLKKLPLIHRDPFDRMLIAQSIAEDLELATCDADIAQYSVKIYPL